MKNQFLGIFFYLLYLLERLLHQLLLFYPERPRAMLAAHKKFLFARCSELMLMTAFVLLYFQHHTTDISLILGYYHTQPILSATDHIVALLLCCVALIKCAQLPLHGWLIQVVESPTPVSALLHAGIINLGGFLLLLFAPLLSLAIFAQWLLLVVAGLSCVVAALVMMTRISIKVRLAWSTIAQMGLMLIECALGLYELALLHLLAHSCYKAHAFLVSGEAVNHYLRKRYVQADLPNAMHWFAAACCVTAVSFVLIIARGLPVLWSPWILIAIAVLSMLAFHFQSNSAGLSWRAIWIAVLGVMVYTVAGQLTHQLVPTVSVPQAYADAWVSLLFISLFWLFLLIQYAPHGPTQRRWFIALNAGFYLDEWSTRATLYLWPISLPATQSKNVALSQSTNVINSNEVK